MTTIMTFRSDWVQFWKSKQRHSSRQAAIITAETMRELRDIK